MNARITWRSSVGRQFEFMEFELDGPSVAHVRMQVDALQDDDVLALGAFHKALSGALNLAWEMGHESAVQQVQDGLGASVHEEISEPEETRPAPSWAAPVEPKRKPWEDKPKPAPKASGLEGF